MRELTDWRAPLGSAFTLPDDVRAEFDDFAKQVKRRSQIVWGEHCSECTFPACYASCAYYTPRGDFNCRRFERGMESLAVGELSLCRIRFRKWGKLEGAGPLRLLAPQAAVERELRQQSLAKLLRLAPGERLAERIARRVTQRAVAASAGADLVEADAFVVETWLADDVEIPFTLTIVPTDKSQSGLFQHRFAVRQGYCRTLVPASRIAATVDLAQPFLVQIEPLIEAPPHDVVFGLADFVSLKTARAVSGPTPAKTAKCVVWDLDNVMWRGTLAEDGIDGIVLNQDAVAAIKALDARGILNSVASKNDERPGIEALEQFGVREYVLFPQIGWGPKSDSLRAIASLLDIGIDTFVFIDDQAFERGEVSHALPEVRVLSDADIPGLIERPFFDAPATKESVKRRRMYQDEERRQATFAGSGTDYLAFLRTCGIGLTITRPSLENAERLFELAQRTNQLNFAASRLSRAEIDDLVAGVHPLEAYVLRCTDTFGDYGIIGLVLVDSTSATIEAFFMSCRVQRKRVEHALFEMLRRRLLDRGHTTMQVRFKRSAKNGASVRMLEELGFTGDARLADGEGLFTRTLSAVFDPDVIVSVDDQTEIETEFA